MWQNWSEKKFGYESFSDQYDRGYDRNPFRTGNSSIVFYGRISVGKRLQKQNIKSRKRM